MASDQLNKIFYVPYIHYNILTREIDYLYIFIVCAHGWLWRYRSRHSAVTSDLRPFPVYVKSEL